MSDPTQQDRERAKADAKRLLQPPLPELRDGETHSFSGEAMHNMVRCYLALLAEREGWIARAEIAKQAIDIAEGHGLASGRRAGLLELAEKHEASASEGIYGSTEFGRGFKEAFWRAASHARAMASAQPSTPSRMDDPDE